tara:strand:- start:167 stop:451 length:285 start_codon:yes stop_codon:yes gene_type:complete
MIITIEGKRASGKSTLAEKITRGSKTVHASDSMFIGKFWNFLKKDTEYIIVDDVEDEELFRDIFDKDTIQVNHLNKKTFSMKTPHIILIKQYMK